LPAQDLNLEQAAITAGNAANNAAIDSDIVGFLKGVAAIATLA
jgi:hypothetical protein